MFPYFGHLCFLYTRMPSQMKPELPKHNIFTVTSTFIHFPALFMQNYVQIAQKVSAADTT